MIEYTATYEHDLNEKSLYSCSLLCLELNDIFNEETKSATIHKSFQNDYFNIIYEETLQGRLLVALNLNSILYPFFKRDVKFDTKIYKVSDKTFRNRSSNIFEDNRVNQNLVLLFVNCSIAEAGTLLFYLLNYEDGNSYANVTYRPPGHMYDLSHVYPMTIVNFGFYKFLISNVLTMNELNCVIYQDEFPIQFPGIQELDAYYALHLLGEATRFEFPLRWSNSTLYIGKCGYNQALDIQKRYIEILTDISRLGVIYQNGPGGSRAFTCNGEFYSLVNKTNNNEIIGRRLSTPRSIIFIDTEEDRQYFKELGYIIVDSPAIEVPISWRTVDSEGELTTKYYIKSSSGMELSIVELPGSYSAETEERLKRQDLFSQRAKNYMRSYDLIPSDMLRL